jgi:hypothetical protein
MKEDKTGGACDTYGGGRKCYRFLAAKTEGRDHLEDPGLDRIIILKLVLNREDMEWIRQAQNRDKGRAVVKTFPDYMSNY